MTTEQRGAESMSDTTVLSAEPIPDSIDPGAADFSSHRETWPLAFGNVLQECAARRVSDYGKRGLAWNVDHRGNHAKDTRARLRARRDARGHRRPGTRRRPAEHDRAMVDTALHDADQSHSRRAHA